MKKMNYVDDIIISGYLKKWTGFLRGYQNRWFVVKNEYINYYLNENEAKLGRLKGQLSLKDIIVKNKNFNEFELKSFKSKIIRIKAKTNEQKDKWILALVLARNRLLNPFKIEYHVKNESITQLENQIEELNIYNSLVQRQSYLLANALNDLLKNQLQPDKNLLQKINQNTEQFKLIINKMLNKCEYFANLSIDKCKSRDSDEFYDVIEEDTDMIKIYPKFINESPIEKTRRKTIPLKPNYQFNLWKIAKTWIGKDFHHISMPIFLSEPLSMIQRLTEDLEYYNLLDKASKCDDSLEQMVYVAAFSITSYSTTALRTVKPFDPCLGETYECDRWNDLGWRSLGELVSANPSKIAIFAESKNGWKFYGEYTEVIKFRGHYLQIEPVGTIHIEFTETGNHYTWRKVTTFVRNLIMGKVNIDNVGECDIINHRTKDVCHLKYFPQSFLNRDQNHKVSGIINDSQNIAQYIINGAWDKQINYAQVLNPQIISEKTQLKLNNSTLIWSNNEQIVAHEQMYNFTKFGIELNELEDDVAPTDSRLRPDIRLMEQGQWDRAHEEKLRIELKSCNQARKQQSHKSVWFDSIVDPLTNQIIHYFNGNYWDCKIKKDWSRSRVDLF